MISWDSQSFWDPTEWPFILFQILVDKFMEHWHSKISFHNHILNYKASTCLTTTFGCWLTCYETCFTALYISLWEHYSADVSYSLHVCNTYKIHMKFLLDFLFLVCKKSHIASLFVHRFVIFVYIIYALY